MTGNRDFILVVDDEPQLRDIAGRMLQSIGYTVDSVCSGELAIKYLRDNPVDLLVIDMQMEPGMNGYETYQEIIKLYPKQKAVIASGFSNNEEVNATLELGANGFIKKPYSMEQLGWAVKEALSK
ncbi:MAG: response regulator [Candidatus Electrothrix sp. AR4]|nr:response regulator [Candidatus Electrothrix sp. AR4]